MAGRGRSDEVVAVMPWWMWIPISWCVGMVLVLLLVSGSGKVSRDDR